MAGGKPWQAAQPDPPVPPEMSSAPSMCLPPAMSMVPSGFTVPGWQPLQEVEPAPCDAGG